MFAIYYQGIFWAKSKCFAELCELASLSLGVEIIPEDITMFNSSMSPNRISWVGIDAEISNEIDLNAGYLPHKYDPEQRIMKLKEN